MPAVATRRTEVSRPLKVLIPLIQSELQQGNDAGLEHYRRAGEMLIEAREQVSHGAWGTWLTKNFDLSDRTARRYMLWARQFGHREAEVPFASLREMGGDTQRRREEYRSEQQQDFRRVLRDVARDDFNAERQARDREVNLHRELAAELIDLGYRALATKLHPDRGGTKDAMMRLNRVRDELKAVAQTRRFL
jgi:hypothetical protein